MSTYFYLTCFDHNPHLVASDESGQHWSDLPEIQEDLARRESIVELGDIIPRGHFRQNTFKFLRQHPTCDVRIISETGIDATNYTAEGYPRD